jgi:hypothetical protein
MGLQGNRCLCFTAKAQRTQGKSLCNDKKTTPALVASLLSLDESIFPALRPLRLCGMELQSGERLL